MKRIAFALMLLPGAALAHEAGGAHHHGAEIALLAIALCVSAAGLLRSRSQAKVKKN